VLGRRSALADLERRSYKSYLARVQTERRLRRVGLTWNAAQTSLAVALIAVSVLYLAFPSSQSDLMVVYLISLSVLALAVSISVGSLDYSGRAREMFRNYRDLQSFSARVESIQKVTLFSTRRSLAGLQAEYDLLIDQAENHSNLDYELSQVPSGDAGVISRRRLLMRRSVPFLLPLALMVIAGTTTSLSFVSSR